MRFWISSASGRTSSSARWSTPTSAAGGEAWGVPAGERYVDVGTLHGYREAMRALDGTAPWRPGPTASALHHAEGAILTTNNGTDPIP